MTNTTSKKKILGLGAASVIAFSLIGAGVAQAGAMGAFDQSVTNNTVIAAVKGGFTQQQVTSSTGATTVGNATQSSADGTASTELSTMFGKVEAGNIVTDTFVKYTSTAGTGINQNLYYQVTNVKVFDASGVEVTDTATKNAVLGGLYVQFYHSMNGAGLQPLTSASMTATIANGWKPFYNLSPNLYSMAPGAFTVLKATTTSNVNNAYQGYSVTADFQVKATTV